MTPTRSRGELGVDLTPPWSSPLSRSTLLEKDKWRGEMERSVCKGHWRREGREGQPPSRSKVVDAGVSKAQRRKETAKTHLKVVPV